VVLADDHADLDQLGPAVVDREGGPGGVVDAVVVVQLVGRPQQRGLGVGPAVGVGTLGDPGDLVVGQPGAAADRHVVVPLVVGPAVPGGAQDQQLALAPRQLAPEQQDAAERAPAPEQPRVVRDRGEDVGHVAAVGRHGGEHLVDGLGPPLRRHRGDTLGGYRMGPLDGSVHTRDHRPGGLFLTG
jgi:hypothetical protein